MAKKKKKKALQYVNIIKDSHEDIKEGRCFIPQELMQKHGCALETFFDSENIESSRKVYLEMIEQAELYLNEAIEYIKNIPVKNKDIRLFCIGPALLAYKTLAEIKKDISQLITNPKTFKISKLEVGIMMAKAMKAKNSNEYFDQCIQEIQRKENIE